MDGGPTLGSFVDSKDVGMGDVGCCVVVGAKLNTPSPTGLFVDSIVGGVENTSSPTGRFVGLELGNSVTGARVSFVGV